MLQKPLKQNLQTEFRIRSATGQDVGLILRFIYELAEYERMADKVVATEAILQQTLFGEKRYAEVIIGEYQDAPVAFAVFFHNFSTFLGQPGIYLEDLYVKPDVRGKGFGKKMLAHLAQLARERNCGRLDWSVLDWNKPAIDFYTSIGAKPMADWKIFRLSGQALEQLALQGQ